MCIRTHTYVEAPIPTSNTPLSIIIIIIIIIVNDINIIINSTIIISPALMFGSISVLLESATGLVR